MSKAAGARLAAVVGRIAARPPPPPAPPIVLAERRAAFARALPPEAMAVLPGGVVSYCTHDIPHRWRQQSDFMYLTGFDEPDAVLVLRAREGEVEDTLVVRPRDLAREMWDGPRADAADLVQRHGVRRGCVLDALEAAVREAAAGSSQVLYDAAAVSVRSEAGAAIAAGLRAAGAAPVRSGTPVLHSLRLQKSPGELELMRAASAASAVALEAAMAATHPGVLEHHLDATLEFAARMSGGSGLAYPPVVAGGERANTLHYITNDAAVSRGEMVLVDAGAEVGGYAGDISRTWPADGRFTAPQRAVYEAVLGVQRACLDACVVDGRASLMTLHALSLDATADALEDLGIAMPQGMAPRRAAVRRFYPHGVGHWLGMDVHDTSTVSQGTPFRSAATPPPHRRPRRADAARCSPGMVITVEPGIYLGRDDPAVPAELRGMGVRIEDDVCFTEAGAEVMTAACPKTVDQVEAAIGAGQ